ncbi:MAG: hypothetical protein RL226_703 [Bacteroidota bacterium]
MRSSVLCLFVVFFGVWSPLSAQIAVPLPIDTLTIASYFSEASISSSPGYYSGERMLDVSTKNFALRYFVDTNGVAYECYVTPANEEAATKQVNFITTSMPKVAANIYSVTENELGVVQVQVVEAEGTNDQGFTNFIYRFAWIFNEAVDDDKDLIIAESMPVIAVQEPDFDENEPLPIAVVSSPPLYGRCTADDANPAQCSYDAIQKHVAKKLRLPEEVAQKGIKGRVFVKLVIDTTGEVESCEIVRGLNSAELDAAVLRAFRSLGRFSPPSDRDKPCRVFTLIPVSIEPK